MQKRAVTFTVPAQAKHIISARTLGASLAANAKILDSDILFLFRLHEFGTMGKTTVLGVS